MTERECQDTIARGAARIAREREAWKAERVRAAERERLAAFWHWVDRGREPARVLPMRRGFGDTTT